MKRRNDDAQRKRRPMPDSAQFARAALLFVSTCAGLLLFPSAVEAHAIGLSRGDYRATADGLDVTFVLARAEALAVVPALEAKGVGAIDASSVAAAREALTRGTIDKIRVTAATGACAGTLIDAFLTEQDGFEIRGRYRCPRSDESWTVTLPLLDDLSHGHRHAAHVVAGGVATDHLLSRSDATFRVPHAAQTSSASSDAAAPPARALGFLRMGVEHILTGYDHLFFLLALVLAGGTIRSLALAITSFTVAHSLTLALAVLGFVAPPARWIEPAIALSVAYVGLENFFSSRSARAWITFPFGLVHGFGFAGALTEVAIPRADVPWALLSFNVGVEIGQLTWMLVLGLAVALLRRRPWFAKLAVPLLSALVVAVGLVWFVGRVRDPAAELRGVACAGARCG